MLPVTRAAHRSMPSRQERVAPRRAEDALDEFVPEHAASRGPLPLQRWRVATLVGIAITAAASASFVAIRERAAWPMPFVAPAPSPSEVEYPGVPGRARPQDRDRCGAGTRDPRRPSRTGPENACSVGRYSRRGPSASRPAFAERAAERHGARLSRTGGEPPVRRAGSPSAGRGSDSVGRRTAWRSQSTPARGCAAPPGSARR